MDRSSFVRWLAGLLMALTVAPGNANDLPLGIFSSDTGLAVRLNSPSTLAGNSKGFLAQAAPQFASIADQLSPAMGSLIGNPTLIGVDGERPWYLVGQFHADKQPALIFSIPTKDAEAMKTALGTTYTARAYGDWLVYSRDKEAIDALPDAPFAAENTISATLSPELLELFNSGDIGLFLNLPAISKIYQPEIDQFKEQLKDGSGAPNLMANAQISPELIDFLGEVLAGSQALVSNIIIDDNAIFTNATFLADPESRIGKLIAGQPNTSPSLLDRLPAGSMVYFGSTAGLTDISRIATELFPGQPNAEQAKKAVEAVLAHEPQEFASVFDLKPSDQGAYHGISLTQFGKPEGLLEALREIAKTTPHVETEGWQQDTTWNAEAETLEETKVDVVRTVMTIDPQADPNGNLNQLMKLLLGEEGFTQRFAIVNNLLVQTNGGNTKLMAQALGFATTKPEAPPENPGLKTLRDQLGPEAHVLLAFDVPRSVGAFLALLVESGAVPLPGNAAETINNADQTASYTGIQAHAKDNQVHFHGIFPAIQVKGLVDLGMTLQQASQRGN